jgi:hypothetical protein
MSIPLFQKTETMHGNFKARVTVLISAINPNLNILVLLINDQMILLLKLGLFCC